MSLKSMFYVHVHANDVHGLLVSVAHASADWLSSLSCKLCWCVKRFKLSFGLVPCFFAVKVCSEFCVVVSMLAKTHRHIL